MTQESNSKELDTFVITQLSYNRVLSDRMFLDSKISYNNTHFPLYQKTDMQSLLDNSTSTRFRNRASSALMFRRRAQFLANWQGVEIALVMDCTDLNDRLSLLFVGIATEQRVRLPMASVAVGDPVPVADEVGRLQDVNEDQPLCCSEQNDLVPSRTLEPWTGLFSSRLMCRSERRDREQQHQLSHLRTPSAGPSPRPKSACRRTRTKASESSRGEKSDHENDDSMPQFGRSN